MRYSKEHVLGAHAGLTKMPPPFEGGCECGGVRYRCTSAPFWSTSCYCRDCQKQGASACTTAFTIRTSAFVLLAGELLEFTSQADSGNTVSRMRCRHCGVWVFAQRSNKPAWRSVIASTLDDPDGFVLISNAFISSAPSWAAINPDIMQFERMPEDELPGFTS